jgi:hypothetical protein
MVGGGGSLLWILILKLITNFGVNKKNANVFFQLQL